MTMKSTTQNNYLEGFRDGIPIGLGYVSVSFAFGMMAVNLGLPVWSAVLISLTNLTSAGQFAGINLISTGTSLAEMALTQFVINIRYALMSLSLSQKADRSITAWHRLFISFGITDEVFAVASGKPSDIGRRYMYGLITVPYFGWALGTLLGAAASGVLPLAIRSALGIAIYGMFLAIIIPPAKYSRPILKVLLLAIALSMLLNLIPAENRPSGGFIIIICAILASAVGAIFFPLKEVKG